MSDLISRQALHERINETVNEGLIFSGMTIAEFIEALIDSMPSAERKGKWVNHRNDDGHNIADCNLCGNTLQWFDNDGEHNYCPNCGARMEGEEE